MGTANPRLLTLAKAGFDRELIAVLEHLNCRTVGDVCRITRRQLACLPPSVCRDAFGQATWRCLNRRLGNLDLPEIKDDPEVAALVVRFNRDNGRRQWATLLPVEWVGLRDTVSRFGCRTLGDVRRLKRRNFARLRGYGQCSWQRANKVLKRYGLKPIPDDPQIRAQHDALECQPSGVAVFHIPALQRARGQVQTLGGQA
jgi:hypothetical protein